MSTASLTQGTEEWMQARVGRATASNFKHILATTKKGEPTAARTTYLWQQVIERLTGQPAPVTRTVAMAWGTEQEPAAREAYLAAHMVTVDQVGFLPHPVLATGCSPDGLVTEDGRPDGLIEIKCPFNSANHLETWLHGMPQDHMAQVQGQMWITSRAWCDFISFDSRMPADLQLYVQRIPRNPEFIAMLEAAIIRFLGEVTDTVAALQAKTSF